MPTKNRVIRVPEAEWVAAKVEAHNRGETVTDVIRRALRDYTGTPGGSMTPK